VGKTFRRGGRRTVALAGVGLDVRAGELICLLGPSGCGKSTLLRIVAGALTCDQGTVVHIAVAWNCWRISSRRSDGKVPT
jgi:ABC-type Fe3+/spermidine/putrescine transport system ATPase subunit